MERMHVISDLQQQWIQIGQDGTESVLSPFLVCEQEITQCWRN